MPDYKTPGVYVEEVSTLPPSIAEVSTAIPAFIGYTETSPQTTPTIARISTLLEYEQLFGRAKPTAFTVGRDAAGNVTGIVRTQAATGASVTPEFLMHYAIEHYFQNGGGSCYIVSIGNYAAPLAKADFTAGLGLLEQEDEPTLILLTDAVNLPAADYHELCQAALSQCKKLKDRFAIFDVKKNGDPNKSDIDMFRDGIGMNGLAYGAAYYPYLETSLGYAYDEASVTLSPPASSSDPPSTMAAIRSTSTALYNQLKTQLAGQRVVLPPSAAMAGIYAAVDRDRGVWKAPANVSVSAVISPISKLTNDMQESLNVDPTAGKSVNGIRTFTGKGTLVWGARTLAGNDNEWRFISVRRLFNLIEESACKGTAFAVFEPNELTTWLKVKGTIESFLYSLWEKGALAGSTPEAAYFVNVGLGKTMTTKDVLEGRMIVEIGVAAVRPAEFIILKFTHKLQEG